MIAFLFAWYGVTASTLNAASTPASKVIAAAADTYDLGASIELATAFEAVSDESNPYYNVVTGAPQYLPTFDSTNGFGDVDLTNNYGHTYATPGVGATKVNVDSQVKVNLGVANLVVTLNSNSADVLAAIPAAKKGATIVLTKEGNAKILAAKPTRTATDGSGTEGYKHGDITLTLTISAAGDPSMAIGDNPVTRQDWDSDGQNGADGYKWVVKFFYAMAPVNDVASGTETAIDSVGNHSGDTIKTTITINS